MENGERKPMIDERLEALTQSLELFAADMRKMREREERLDARERRGRAAILAAVAAYLNALDEE